MQTAFARFIAIVLLLQGIGPAFMLGVWRPGGWFLAGLAGVYTVLALGIWQEQCWALPAALILTLPQLFVLSSSWFTWDFYVFASIGFGLAPGATIMETTFFPYRSFGGRLNFAFGYSQSLTADYASIGQQSFVLFNILALPLVVMLLVHFAIRLVATESHA